MNARVTMFFVVSGVRHRAQRLDADTGVQEFLVVCEGCGRSELVHFNILYGTGHDEAWLLERAAEEGHCTSCTDGA